MKLFKKGYIGTLELNNRVIMAPMNVGGNNESDGCLSKRGIDYFVERAKGGTGMIITGAVRVTRDFERDQKTIPLWMLFADHMIHAKWISELSERCHDYGTKVCLQLTPGGGASSWCICSAA
jgi:2-enoate reductase